MTTLVMMFLTSFLRHALTTLAGVLVAKGLISPDLVGPFNEIVLGLGAGTIGFVWSLLKNWRAIAGLK